jgi:hypothetical protein
MFVEDNKNARTAPVLHQKQSKWVQRTILNTTRMLEKSTAASSIRPLITVWLQARVRVNHLRYQQLITFTVVRGFAQTPEIRRSYCPE